jgi:IS4 transposase
VYLRETKRRNKDGSTVSYLQLAHNERHPVSGSPVARVIHNFGRADELDHEALRRLVKSISRFLEPDEAASAGAGLAEVEVVESRRYGGAWVLDRLFARLGVTEALRAAARGRRLDPELSERVCFALVAQRALEPGSKLAATRWAAERVALPGCPAFTDAAAYRAMDFLLAALPEIAEGVFASTASLLNLACDVIFVDTSSTYFETEAADEEVELETTLAEEEARAAAAAATGEAQRAPAEAAVRRFSRHSKDKRADLPQVVIGMAVTSEGIPVRCWTFPGHASDQLIIRTVHDDLAGWKLNRVLWVADRGFNSVANRAYLQKGGGHYVLAERLRSGSAETRAALARAGRYQQVAGNLEVKEVRLGEGLRAPRFVVVHNPEAAERDRCVRERLVAYLEEQIAGADEWPARRRDELVGTLRTRPALLRLLRRTKQGLLRLDRAALGREARLDGKWLLRTSDESLSAADLAAAYRQLYQVERGWRDMKGALALRPVFHHREDRLRAHVQLCWLALLLIRVAENATGESWRCVREELERLHLVTLESAEGRVVRRSRTTASQRRIFKALELPEPALFSDFEVATASD